MYALKWLSGGSYICVLQAPDREIPGAHMFKKREKIQLKLKYFCPARMHLYFLLQWTVEEYFLPFHWGGTNNLGLKHAVDFFGCYIWFLPFLFLFIKHSSTLQVRHAGANKCSPLFSHGSLRASWRWKFGALSYNFFGTSWGKIFIPQVSRSTIQHLLQSVPNHLFWWGAAQTLLPQTNCKLLLWPPTASRAAIIPVLYLCAFLSQLCESRGTLPPPPIPTKDHCLLFN